MQKRWTALALAALMLLTASCHRTAEPSGDGSQTPQIGWRPQDTSAQSSASEADPVKPPPAWEEGRTLEDLPDDYNGLELPIQGATGYAPVEMALWADPADRDAAAQAVEDWEKAQEEKKRLEEEQKRLEEEQKRLEEEQAKAEAAAQSQAQQGGGETAAPAEPGPSPAGSADQSGVPEEPSEGEAASEEEKEPAAQPEAPAPEESGVTAPPELTVTGGDASCTALRGGWSWTIQEGEDQYSSTISDSAHPLSFQDLTPSLNTAGPDVALSFPMEPDTLTVQCWPESAWGNVDANSAQAAVEGDLLTLKPGGWIYEVCAGWDAMPDYEGECRYSFFVRQEGN